jgi:hypothetical protein
MEFDVEDSNRNRRKFLKAILPSMIDQLGLTNSRKALLVKIDADIDGADGPNLGCTINLDFIDSYMVLVKPGPLLEVAATLAHEMVHVRQYAKGMLKPMSRGKFSWMGKVYPKKTKYLDMPWELDAFAKQEIVMRRAIEV